MDSPVERVLIEIVQRQLNAGSKTVTVPGDLVAKARPEILSEVRRLCKLAGARIDVEA